MDLSPLPWSLTCPSCVCWIYSGIPLVVRPVEAGIIRRGEISAEVMKKVLTEQKKIEKKVNIHQEETIVMAKHQITSSHSSHPNTWVPSLSHTYTHRHDLVAICTKNWFRVGADSQYSWREYGNEEVSVSSEWRVKFNFFYIFFILSFFSDSSS